LTRRAARHASRRRILHLRRAPGCFGTSRSLSRDSSSTTSPRAGSSSTTSPTPRVRVPRHVARLVTRLIVDYFTSRGLVVDYFAYAACPAASARRAARHVARRRLLHLRRASGFFGTSRGFSRDSSSTTSLRAGSSSTTSPTPRVRVPRHIARLVTLLVVDYFDYTARPGASARRTTHHVARRRLLHLRRAACRVTHRRLLRLAQARCRLLRLRRVCGCLGTSRGSSRGSSSITSTMPRVRVPQHVARLITRLVAPLVVDYFDYAARPGASACRAAHHATRCTARRRLLRLRCASGCLGTSRGSSRRLSSTTSPPLRVRVPRHVA
jgi:hypothetical protein